MSEFMGFIPPPGEALHGYDSTQIHSAQSDSRIPEVFRDAMSVREEVYVDEQKIPLENEFDSDDPRSWHWVAYASVGNAGAGQQSHQGSGSHPESRDKRKGSTATKVAVGTIRMVPPPHPPHPEPGSSHKIDNAEGVAPDVEVGKHQLAAHSATEPYVKLGRLAILKPYRGLGLSNLLVNAALSWAAHHPEDILPPLSPAAAEHRRLELGGVAEREDHWRGLVLIHAQLAIADKFWAKYGFVRDESMGVWDEEGIDHCGMFKRIEVKGQVRKGSG